MATTKRQTVSTSVPDGGWGWVVCLASFWIYGVIGGVFNSFGVLYVAMLDLDGADAFKTSWVGSVCTGLTFFLSPIASLITDKFGCRPTAILGSTLALAGILCSSFATRIEHLYITYGLTMGIGFAIVFQPCVFILGMYFQKRLGLVNGIVCSGGSIFTVVLPICMREILKNYGLQQCIWLLSSIIFVMLLGTLTYRPRPDVVDVLDTKEVMSTSIHRKSADDYDDVENGNGCFGILCKRMACRPTKCCHGSTSDVSIWKERNYRLWAIGMAPGWLGYYVPIFHLVKYVNETIPEAPAELIILCFGATSGIGRFFAGVLSDHPKINPVHIQQLAFLVFGVLTTLLPIIQNFVALCATILVMGVFDGAMNSTIGPIAFSLVGLQRASQAIGAAFCILSLPILIGPPIAGFLHDLTGNYTLSFVLAGIPPMITVCTLFFIRPDQSTGSREKINEEEGGQGSERDLAPLFPRKATPSTIDNLEDIMTLGNGTMDDHHDDVWKRRFTVNDGMKDNSGRRSYIYKRDGMSSGDNRIIRKNPIPNSSGYQQKGVQSKRDFYRSTPVYTDGCINNMGLARGNGPEREGNRSPYDQQNHTRCKYQKIKKNRALDEVGIKFDMKGIVQRKDLHTGQRKTTIKVIGRETAV